jgi:hypothetical protein
MASARIDTTAYECSCVVRKTRPSPSHGGNTGSNPVCATNSPSTYLDSSAIHAIFKCDPSGDRTLSSAESARSDYCQHDEKCDDDELREQERRFGLLRSDRLECRDLLESLHDPDEDIQIERNHGGDHVDPTPGAAEVERVAREDRNRQHQQRLEEMALRAPLVDLNAAPKHDANSRPIQIRHERGYKRLLRATDSFN